MTNGKHNITDAQVEELSLVPMNGRQVWYPQIRRTTSANLASSSRSRTVSLSRNPLPPVQM